MHFFLVTLINDRKWSWCFCCCFDIVFVIKGIFERILSRCILGEFINHIHLSDSYLTPYKRKKTFFSCSIKTPQHSLARVWISRSFGYLMHFYRNLKWLPKISLFNVLSTDFIDRYIRTTQQLITHVNPCDLKLKRKKIKHRINSKLKPTQLLSKQLITQ